MGMLAKAAMSPAFDEFDHLELPEYFFTSVPKLVMVGPCLRMTFTLDEIDRGQLVRLPVFRAICPLENVQMNMADVERFLAGHRAAMKLISN